jgi:1A family penicillin-binding protein
MEINFSKLFRQLISPVVWLGDFFSRLYITVKGLFSNKGHSRRSSTWKRLVSGRVGRKHISPLSPASQATLQLRRVKLLRLAAISFLLLVILGIVGFFGAFAYFSRDLPQPGEVMRRDGFSTKIYDRNEQLLFDVFTDERRTPTNLDQIPEALRQATVAIEDKDFYKHQGFDVLTIVRIPYNLLVKRRVVGGSTLTQQLVKNVLLSNERTASRKFKELVLAIQIERTFSKDDILEMYLNEVPYGGTAWGAVSAAELYFNKPVNELSLLESAFLAGLPQRPSAYSPFSGQVDDDGTPLWQLRTRGVLNRMKEDGYITSLQYEQALAELPGLSFERGTLEIKAPHFVFYVKEKLIELYGEEVVERGGLKVITSLDLDIQDKAQQIVSEEVTAVEHLHITNGASLMMDPQTGEILAMVGSRDFFDNESGGGQFNVVTTGLRQPGSSIKPITYLALLKKGYTPASMLVDAPTDFRHNTNEPPYTPRNYTGRFAGPVSVRQALGNSLNVPAVKALSLVGVEDFLTLAEEMGLTSLAPTAENLQRFGLALTLGGGEVRLLDMVTAYSAFANGGKKIEPVAILKVEDRTGRVLFQHHPLEGQQVMTEGEAFLINDILSDNGARTMAFGANSLLNTGKPIAVKTGTTNDMIDNWTIGWSQEVIVGTWVGNNDNSSMTQVASGVTGASPIWRKTISMALEAGYQTPAWVLPEEVEQVEVDAISGYPVHDDFPKKMEYVIRGTLLSLPDLIHYKAKVCQGENKLASEARIIRNDFEEREVIDLRVEDPVSEDGENRWMEGIRQWLASQDDSRYQVPTEYCDDRDAVSVQLERPKDKEEFAGEEIEVVIRAGSDRGIEKVELWVDGSKRETVESNNYEGKIKLKAGQHELYAKAFSREGQEAQSDVIHIGTGGQPWEKPEPTPTPQPTSTPKPKATSTPTLTPKPPKKPEVTSIPTPTPI